MATIIKAESVGQATGTPLRQVAYDLTDFAVHAEDYFEQIRQQAAQMLAEARREAEAVRKQAEQAGRAAAEQAIDRVLDEKVAKQMQSLAPALRAATSELRDAKQHWLAHWEEAAVALAVALAQRIVRGELTRRPEISTAWIREALELAAGHGALIVELNPQDVAALGPQAQQLAKLIGQAEETRVQGNPAVATGGCRVLHEFGEVDLQLESQLAQLAQELLGA